MKEELEFDQVYNKIQELLKSGRNNISVLEEQVDVELQLEYFNTSKKLFNKIDKDVVILEKDLLVDESVDVERKKEILSSLAKLDKPEAFRVLEDYKNNPDNGLEQWSKLAFQESKMVLETSLLGEAPIFISTGLGGQGNKLRYFIVLVANEGVELEEWQNSLANKELTYAFEANDGLVETVQSENDMILITALLPIENNVQKTVTGVVKECNELGNFLKDSFIVTNVKKLSVAEIRKMVQEKGAGDKEDLDDIEGLGNGIDNIDELF